MNNERGGIISKLFIIPAGVALMVGFFFLGYYVGKYQAKQVPRGELAPALPEAGPKDLPKQEEFTFYKTLTDKENKTVSIDLKAGRTNEEQSALKNDAPVEAPKEKHIEIKKTKDVVAPASPQQQAQAKKAPAATSSNAKLRYTVQTASYQEKEMAEDEVKKLKKQGYAAFIVSSEVPGKGLWHRVRLGSFANKAAAEKLQKELHAKAGSSSIVVIE